MNQYTALFKYDIFIYKFQQQKYHYNLTLNYYSSIIVIPYLLFQFMVLLSLV